MTLFPPDFSGPKDASEEIFSSLFASSGVDGVLLRTGAYEDVVDGLGRFINGLRPENAEVYRFPPVASRALVEKSGYLKSFPHLLGCVCGLGTDEFRVNEALGRFEAGGNWTDSLAPTDLVLAPAACYPVYPLAARRGPIGPELLTFDVAGDCFRREPSRDIDRLQSFRMREFVAIGASAEVSAYRNVWMGRAAEIAGALVLPHRIDVASDPFFGRDGVMVGRFQLADALKFEMLIPVRSEDKPTACMSFNYHRDHFGKTWGLRLANGGVAESACVAFGIDRLAIALFVTHGLKTRNWPLAARESLGL